MGVRRSLALVVPWQVLALDGVGLLPVGGAGTSAEFFRVVSTRCENGHSAIVTTNRGLPDWGTLFGDAIVVTEQGGAGLWKGCGLRRSIRLPLPPIIDTFKDTHIDA